MEGTVYILTNPAGFQIKKYVAKWKAEKRG